MKNLVVFRLEGQSYGIALEKLEEILPVVQYRSLPGTPDGLAGLILYRGDDIPLIDLTLLITGNPSRPVYSTRILIVGDPEKRFGLLIDGATGLEQIDANRGDKTAGIPLDLTGAPWLTEILHSQDDTVHLIDPLKILTAEIRRALGTEPVHD